ncbi:MAG: hypothetical protein GY909_11140 [Oligoflexia bacterium]|nr:hypothetical protein [Oligoflexia bacterium]
MKKQVPSTGIGPIPNNEFIGKKSIKKRSAVVGLYLAPALFRSLSYLPLLNSLKQQEIKINIIASHGFPTLIASLYSQNLNSDLIEWEMHKLLSPISDRPLSERWNEKIKQWAMKEFDNKRIESGKITLLVPIQNEFETRGLITSSITSMSEHRDGQISINGLEKMKSLGADIIICFDAVGKNENLAQTCDIYIDSNSKNFKIDDVSILSDILAQGSKDSYEHALKIKKYIKQWNK